MPIIIPFETPGGTVWIQIEDKADAIQPVTTENPPLTSFQDVAIALNENAQYLQSKLMALNPSSIEITYGIVADITVVGGVQRSVFALATGTEEASYCVKLKWEAQNAEG